MFEWDYLWLSLIAMAYVIAISGTSFILVKDGEEATREGQVRGYFLSLAGFCVFNLGVGMPMVVLVFADTNLNFMTLFVTAFVMMVVLQALVLLFNRSKPARSVENASQETLPGQS